MIRRKPFEDESDNHDRWLVSYADFITLLFAFFVVMYGISSVNQIKYKQLSTAIGVAFNEDKTSKSKLEPISSEKNILGNQQPSLIKPLPLNLLRNEQLKRQHETMIRIGINLSQQLSNLVSQGKVKVIQNNRGIRIDINDNLLFATGSAELSENAEKILTEISGQIKDSDHLIQVEGHTDNTPIHTDSFFSNWELSAVRASSVVRMLSETGIAENRLSAVGYGSAQPISDNDTPEGRARNRRVSIMILYETRNQEYSASEISP